MHLHLRGYGIVGTTSLYQMLVENRSKKTKWWTCEINDDNIFAWPNARTMRI